METARVSKRGPTRPMPHAIGGVVEILGCGISPPVMSPSLELIEMLPNEEHSGVLGLRTRNAVATANSGWIVGYPSKGRIRLLRRLALSSYGRVAVIHLEESRSPSTSRRIRT